MTSRFRRIYQGGRNGWESLDRLRILRIFLKGSLSKGNSLKGPKETPIGLLLVQKKTAKVSRTFPLSHLIRDNLV